MDQPEFEALVRSNLDLLQGVHPESEASLDKYEIDLGFPLPSSMRWLLSNYGYSMACGIENLAGSVKQTLDCRKSISLPDNILLINDWNDGGVVFAIAEPVPGNEYQIIWSDSADIYRLIEGTPLPPDASRFQSFGAWVADRIEFERENGQ
jgi:hypothetical protein